MTDHRSPLDAALDLVLYAPVGLALTLTEELPKLAAKGRSGLGARVTTARVVGQFAVAQGRKEVTRRLGTDAPPARAAAPAPSPASSGPAGIPTADEMSGNGVAPTSVAPTSAAATSAAPTSAAPTSAAPSAASPARGRPALTSEAPVSEAPAVSTLAIPGYDSLSASQVVQRLAGLSGPELQAVKEYESASRGRRTILARVGQLQGH